MKHRLVLNLKQSSCLNILSAEVTGMSHQAQFAFYFMGRMFKRLNVYKSTEKGEKKGERRGKEERKDGEEKGGKRD